LRYIEGPSLIYDCKIGSLICVSEEISENCKNEFSEKITKKIKPDCRPIKEFKTVKTCIDWQKKLIGSYRQKRNICTIVFKRPDSKDFKGLKP